jgi:hypothetical protein
MTMNLKFAALLATAILPVSVALAQSPRPMQRAADEYEELLMTRSYRALEQASLEAHSSQSVIGDGQPRLAAIYAGTAGCVCGDQQTNWNLRGERLREWSKNYPKSITAKVALATYPMQYGWSVRGGGYASTVSPEAWKQFYKYLDDARDALNSLEPDAKNDPGWFDGMLGLATAQQWPRDQFEALYERAQRQHPGYLPIYFTAAGYYSPRWGGSIADLQRFIDRATEATRPKLGETLYARLIWSESRSFEKTPIDWQRMKAGFERIVKDYPDPWNINNYARFACRNVDWLTVLALAERIGDKPVAMAWNGDIRQYYSCTQTARNMKAQTTEGVPRQR